MILNLTKLLEIDLRVSFARQSAYGETGFVSGIEKGTSENQPYSFELESEEV